MYERFTDRSRKVMRLANQEACLFRHKCVGTEHVLLGLIKEGSGIAANVLKMLGVDLVMARAAIAAIVAPGTQSVMGELPQTDRVKEAIEFASEEATLLGHNYIGTEHLLLGLLREGAGIAIQALVNLDVTMDAVRASVMQLIGPARDDDGKDSAVKPRRSCPIPSVERTMSFGLAAGFADTRMTVRPDDTPEAVAAFAFSLVDALVAEAAKRAAPIDPGVAPPDERG